MHSTLQLGEKILNFLHAQGGAYRNITPEIEDSVFYCLGAQQYVLKEVDGEIVYFACYWKIHPEDVELVKQRVRPARLTTGSVMYVVEMASKAGLLRPITELRKTKGIAGVFWHRPTKQDKVYSYMSQHSAR